MENNFTPTVLTIAGSDPYGGAGIQIDCKTIHSLGGYAFSVISAITAQNSLGVKLVHFTPKEVFKAQLETILEDVKIDAVKIGMLGTLDNIKIVIEMIKKYQLKNIVLDTVLVSTSGKQLLETKAIEVMKKELFPLVDLITPNIPEINIFLKDSYEGKSSEVETISQKFFNLGVKAVLIKGGHSLDENMATDYLVQKKLSSFLSYSKDRVKTSHTHGTGCLLSSGIATYLALGYNSEESVRLSKDFLYIKLLASDKLIFNYFLKNFKRKEPIL